MEFRNRKSGRRIASIVKAGSVVAAVIGSGLCPSAARAFDIDTGNGDVAARWDNTLRYTLGERTHGTSYKIMNATNYSDGDANFKSGLVTNRLDVLSEADIVYKKLLGARVSGNFWYDEAYADLTAKPTYWPNQLDGNGRPANGLGPYAQRFFKGPSGELLDGFVFVNPEIGNVSTSLKVGRHTVIWGESLLFAGAITGNSYGQAPIDIAKAYGNPGAEAKELYRPLNNVSLDIQPSSTLSLSAQYFLQWEPFRYPEDGTYFGMYDVAQASGRLLYAQEAGSPNPLLNPYALEHGDLKPHQLGSWGLAARWSPDWLDGTAGVYYRQFSDMSPQLEIQPSTAGYNFLLTRRPGAGYPNLGTYDLTYGSDIHLYGLSLSKEVAGISVGSEFNYRANMPLVSDPGVIVMTGPFARYAAAVPGGTTQVPQTGQTVGARGDTMHALVNMLGTVSNMTVFDTATWATEFTVNRLVGVTNNPNVFLGRSWNLGPADIFKVQRMNGTLAANFTPTWFSVGPNIDLSAPMSVSWGLFNNSPVSLGGNKNTGTFGFGVAAMIQQRYSATLQYVGEMGQLRVGPSGVQPNGLGSLLMDRGAVFLTLKTTF